MKEANNIYNQQHGGEDSSTMKNSGWWLAAACSDRLGFTQGRDGVPEPRRSLQSVYVSLGPAVPVRRSFHAHQFFFFESIDRGIAASS
jgi:hypothetical protein